MVSHIFKSILIQIFCIPMVFASLCVTAFDVSQWERLQSFSENHFEDSQRAAEILSAIRKGSKEKDRILNQISLHHWLGKRISWDVIQSNWDLDHSKKDRTLTLSTPVYQFHGALKHETELQIKKSKTSQVMAVFPATFRLLPMESFHQGNPRAGIPFKKAKLFVMTVSKEFQSQLGIPLDNKFTHLEEAFAYIRFYEVDGNVVISEIQSELFSRVSLEQRKRVRHWAQQILYAFELFVKNTQDSKKIFIATAEYQKQRWINSDQIPEALFRTLYRKLPKKLNYSLNENISYALEWNTDTPETRSVKIPLKRAWERKVIQKNDGLRAPFEQEFEVSFDHQIGRSYEYADSVVGALEQDFLARKQPPGSFRSTSLGMLHSAPSEVLPYTEAYGLDRRLIDTHQRVLRSLPTEMTSFLFQGVTWISHGEEVREGRHVVSSSAQKIIGEQLLGQDRHPFLQFRFPGQKDWSVGFKGGGSRTQTPSGYSRYSLEPRSKHFRFPFLSTKEDGATTRLDSHQIWGGMSELEAKVEWTHALALNDLDSTLFGDSSSALGKPLGVLRYQKVPVFDRNKQPQFWFDVQDYFEKILHLPRGQYSPVSFLSAYRTPKRAVQFEAAFLGFKFSSIRAFHKNAKEVLQSVYGVWGEELNVPTVRQLDQLFQKQYGSFPTSRSLTFLEVCLLLKPFYELNQEAAQRIMEQFERKTLRLIAAVHGAGGHLGGEYYSFDIDEQGRIQEISIGAPNGGAIAPRNVTVFGEMADLDLSIHLPWIDLPHLSKERHLLEAKLKDDLQRLDLTQWRKSVSLMRHLLMGRWSKKGDEELEDRGTLAIVPLGFDWKLEQKYDPFLLRTKGVQFANPQHADLFQSSKEAGEKYAEDWRKESVR